MPLSTKQFQNLVGGYGFESFEGGALEIFNENIASLVKEPVQKGGRVSMPADYFGHPTKAWTASDAGTNPSMAAPTDTIVRPELPSTFQAGGADTNLEKLFQTAIKDFKVQQGGGGANPKKVRMSKDEKTTRAHFFKNAIAKLFAEVRKVASKTKILKAVQLKRAFKKI